jgi:hypothetical protein
MDSPPVGVTSKIIAAQKYFDLREFLEVDAL